MKPVKETLLVSKNKILRKYEKKNQWHFSSGERVTSEGNLSRYWKFLRIFLTTPCERVGLCK